jgi:hypothetical protein
LLAATLLSCVLAKIAHLKLSEKRLNHAIAEWADHFYKITNNLSLHYNQTANAVIDFLEDRDIARVKQVLNELLEAHGKHREGTF